MKPTKPTCSGHHQGNLTFALLILCWVGFISSAWAIDKSYAVFGDSDGHIYTLPHDGKLLWYQHLGRLTGDPTWANNGKASIVSDNSVNTDNVQFYNAKKVFSGDDGVIYIIDTDGRLLWTRHDGRFIGTNDWDNDGKVAVIGRSGWDKYAHVFSGGDGVIYAITPKGKMLWFKHTGWQTGADTWSLASGKEISRGWKGTLKVFSGGDGVIYSIIASGRLRWHKHFGRLTGSEKWANRGIHLPIGFNWQKYNQVFSSGNGIIYATTSNGDLLWFHHLEWLTGKQAWTLDSGRLIAKSFASDLI